MSTLKDLSTPRKTTIESNVDELVVEVKNLIPKEDTNVIVTHEGYLKRINQRSFKVDDNTKLKDNDVVSGIFEVTTVDTILLFTNLGNYVYLPVRNIPEVKHKDLGYHISTLVNIEANEKVIFTVPIEDFDAERFLVFTTRNGLIKRTAIKDLVATRYSRALKATKIRKDDELVSVDIYNGNDSEIVVITKQGFINRYLASEITLMAPASFGVKAIELKARPDDEVVAGKCVTENDLIIMLTERGTIKRIKPKEISEGKRSNVGKQYLQMTKTVSNDVVFAEVVRRDNANSKLDCYLFGTKGYVQVDYPVLRDATASTGKKIKTGNIGAPSKIVITKNNEDFL
jgi:topoisomerase-4 subunit A